MVLRMNYGQAVVTKRNNESLVYVGKVILTKLMYCFLGAVISHGTVLGEYAPFGAAYLAAVPYGNVWAALCGCIFGNILPSQASSGIRYISTALAVGAIRWALSDLKKLNTSLFFASFVAMAPIIATGIAMGTVQGFTITTIINIITEGLLTFAAAYFFSSTIKLLLGARGLTTFSQQELVCISMSLCIALLSFADVGFMGISLGRILAVVVILLCASNGGIPYGCVAGVASGIVFSLYSRDLYYLCGAYAFGGMMAGLFSSLGNIAATIAFIFCNCVIAFQTGDLTAIILGLYEVMISCIVFALIPKRINCYISDIFYNKENKISADSLRKALIMRLESSSEALSAVSNSVTSVSKKLNQIDKTDVNIIYKKAVSSVCNYCGLKVFCWDREREGTKKYINKMASVLKTKGCITQQDLDDEFIDRCCKNSQMLDKLNTKYREFVMRESAERRLNDVRKVLSDQFSSMGQILNDMVNEFKEYESFDFAMENKIHSSLNNIGIFPRDVSCMVDKFGRIFVEIEASFVEKSRLNEYTLARELSQICDRKMDVPCINYLPDSCQIQVSEMPLLNLVMGVSQHICDNGKLCGDNYSYFSDGKGRMMAIISDGMGTGGRAAIDGAIASGVMSNLLKAGLSFDCALKIINSVLLVKSSDESLATLDITCIDLYSGRSDFLKAGAAVTFVRTKGKVIIVNIPSLPIGILNDINFSVENMELETGDIILMMSDGALSTGEDWIKDKLKNWKDKDVQLLADNIVDESIKRRKDGHDDDITVLAMKILDNE